MATQNHKITIIDNEVIERPMTDEEYASIKLEQDRIAARKVESDEAAAALEAKKLEVLAKLGLTADEVAALLA